MKLPSELNEKTEWVFLGPMGPLLPASMFGHPLLCVDGGAQFATTSDVWIGDKDSFQGEINSKHTFHFSTHKDKSDLSLAFDLIQSDFSKTLHLWGFLGGRKDHEIFNLGEALRFLERQPESIVKFYDHEGRVTFLLLSKGSWKISHIGLFSIGSLKEVELKMTGDCLYPLLNRSIIQPFSSHGLSNEAKGTIAIEASGPIFIYYPEDI